MTQQDLSHLSSWQWRTMHRLESLSSMDQHDGWVRVSLLPSPLIVRQLVDMKIIDYRETPVGSDWPGQTIRWVKLKP